MSSVWRNKTRITKIISHRQKSGMVLSLVVFFYRFMVQVFLLISVLVRYSLVFLYLCVFILFLWFSDFFTDDFHGAFSLMFPFQTKLVLLFFYSLFTCFPVFASVFPPVWLFLMSFTCFSVSPVINHGSVSVV